MNKNAYKKLGHFSLSFLLLALLSGCGDIEGAKPEPKAAEAIAPVAQEKPVVKAQPATKTVVQEPANAEEAKPEPAKELTGSAAEYAELHDLFCRQVQGQNLNGREQQRLEKLESLDEKYADASHTSLYKKSHNPDACN